MRILLAALLFAGATLCAPEATAAPAPMPAPAPDGAAATSPAGPPHAPWRRGPIEQPEDWIAVAGIACYVVIPVLLLTAAGVLTYRFLARQADASLVPPVERTAWVTRGAHARPPPGVVLLRF